MNSWNRIYEKQKCPNKQKYEICYIKHILHTFESETQFSKLPLLAN